MGEAWNLWSLYEGIRIHTFVQCINRLVLCETCEGTFRIVVSSSAISGRKARQVSFCMKVLTLCLYRINGFYDRYPMVTIEILPHQGVFLGFSMYMKLPCMWLSKSRTARIGISLLENREFPDVGTYFYFIFATSKKSVIV